MKYTIVTNTSREDINSVTYLDFHHSFQVPKKYLKLSSISTN